MIFKNIFKPYRKENFIIIVISAGLDLDEIKNKILIDIIENSSPLAWELINPDVYEIYFKSDKDNKKNSEKLTQKIFELIRNDERFSKFKIGTSEGDMIVKYNWKGQAIESPLGDAANVAYKNLKGNEEV